MDTGTRAKTLDEFERDEAESDTGKKKKSAKAPKQKKIKDRKGKKAGKGEGAEAVRAGEVGRERRHHPARNAIIFTSLFWMLLIGAVIGVCKIGYTDDFGEYKYLADPEGVIRGPILLFLNPEELPRDEYYSAELEEITSAQTGLEEQQAELDARVEELDAWEEQLDAWESSLQDREDLLEEGMPVNQGGTAADTATPDIAALAKAWGEMTPAKAAAAIEEMSDDAVTLRVLRLVKYKSLGKILDAMSAEEAARISGLLAEPPDVEE